MPDQTSVGTSVRMSITGMVWDRYCGADWALDTVRLAWLGPETARWPGPEPGAGHSVVSGGGVDGQCSTSAMIETDRMNLSLE